MSKANTQSFETELCGRPFSIKSKPPTFFHTCQKTGFFLKHQALGNPAVDPENYIDRTRPKLLDRKDFCSSTCR